MKDNWEIEWRNQLESFLSDNSRNDWLPITTGQVYVRKGTRYIGDKMVKTLEIATISLIHTYRRKGIGTALCNVSHEMNPYTVTLIENVLVPEWAEKLRLLGWIVGPQNASYYTGSMVSLLYKVK